MEDSETGTQSGLRDSAQLTIASDDTVTGSSTRQITTDAAPEMERMLMEMREIRNRLHALEAPPSYGGTYL